jgi:hypothetical protein
LIGAYPTSEEAALWKQTLKQLAREWRDRAPESSQRNRLNSSPQNTLELSPTCHYDRKSTNLDEPNRHRLVCCWQTTQSASPAFRECYSVIPLALPKNISGKVSHLHSKQKEAIASSKH